MWAVCVGRHTLIKHGCEEILRKRKSVALKGKRNYDGRETSKEEIWMSNDKNIRNE